MRAITTVFFMSGALLALFCAALMQYFGFAFDYYFSPVVPGCALLGFACGLALGNRQAVESDEDSAVQWLASSGLVATGCLLVLLYLPLGPVWTFLLLVVVVVAPFLVWGRGGYGLIAGDTGSGMRLLFVGIAGAAAGVLAARPVLDLAGGPVRTAWLVCAALCWVTLLLVRRQTLAFLALSTLLVSGLALYQQDTTRFSLPHWLPGSPYLIKPVLGALSAGHGMTVQPRQWTSAGRTDVLKMTGGHGGYDWLITDATAPVPRVSASRPLPWLLERFPLLAIPLRMQPVHSMLSVNPVPGPEVALAQQLRRTAHDHDADAGSSSPAAGSLRLIYGGHGLPATMAGLHRALQSDTGHYDLVYLPLTQPARAGWAGSVAGEALLYTQEALHSYWSKLNDGGVLAVTTRDEMLFVRMLLDVWSMLSKPQPINGKELLEHAWGMRLTRAAPYKGSYQFLLLVSKGRAHGVTQETLRAALKGLPVEVIFGAGVSAVRPFTQIGNSNSMDAAERKFTAIFSRHFGQYMDFRTTTVERPFLFHLVREAHPYMRWLLTICLGLLLAVMLLPMSTWRRENLNGERAMPPLPVLTGYFVLLAGAVVASGAMLQQSQSGMLVAAWPLPVFCLLAGLAVSGYPFRKRPTRGGRSLVVAPLLMVVALLFAWWAGGAAAAAVAGWQVAAWLVLLAIACLLAGVTAGVSLRSGLSCLVAANLRELLPWVWLAAGLAALAATVLVYWLVLLWNRDVLALVVLAAGLLAAGAGWWMRAWGPAQTV